MSKTKEQRLIDLYTIAKRYPGKKTAVIARLPEFGLTVDDFNAHDSLMVSQNVVEPTSIVDEYPTIPGFTQSDKYSDTEIFQMFEDRDALQDKVDKLKEEVPVDSEWFQAGRTADERISELRPFYETKKAEEWEQFDDAVGMPFMGDLGIMGPIQALTQVFGGWTDLGYDFKEELHERGAFTSLNPLTGFGAWEMAEFQRNPITGQQGFSPELIAIEEELEKLYGDRRKFKEEMREGGYLEALPGSETMQELDRLNQMIESEQLLPPQLFGEQ